MSRKSEDFDNLVQLLRDRAQAEGERLAYTFLVDGDEAGPSYDYAALDVRARAIAGWLQQRVEPGARVLLLYPPGLDALTGLLGCLYAGAVAVPAPPPDAARLKRSLPRLQSIVEDSGASVLCCTGYIGELVEPLQERVEQFAHMQRVDTAAVPDDLAASWTSPRIESQDLAYLQYTSGSTSAAKGVMISHRNVMANLAYNRRLWCYAADSVAVTWMPHFHDYGLVEGLLQPLYSAIPSYVLSPLAFLRRPLRWLQAISTYRATHSAAPNFGYDHCVQQIQPAAGSELDLSSWRVASTGAEMVRPATLERFAETFGPYGFRRQAFFPSFGLAEATLMCTTKAPPEQPPSLLRLDGRELRRGKVVLAEAPPPGAQGDPTAGVTLVGCGTVDTEFDTAFDTALAEPSAERGAAPSIAIADPETGRRCQPDEVGEIWIGGPFIGEGYWQRPELSQEVFRARLTGQPEAGTFLRTGDLGFVHTSRDLQVQDLYIVSRIKDMMIIRGYNHYPPDIEATVEAAHPLLRANCCAVFSVEVRDEERVVVVVEVERSFRDEQLPEVAGAIREAVLQGHELQLYALRLLRRGTLPKTSSGKVQRRAAKEAFLADTLQVVAQLTQSETAGSASLLAALLASEAGEAAGAPVAERLSTELLATPVGQRRQRLEGFIAAAIAQVMELPAEAVETAQPLSQLGLDSLMAAQLRNRLERELDTTVPVPELLSGSTAQLTEDLLERLQATELLAQLDDLSDDAVGELLHQMLATEDA